MAITYAIGQRVTGELMQQLADYTVNRPVVKLVQQIAQPLATGAVTPIQFGAASTVFDTDDFHSETVNNTRVTPTVAGIYELTGAVTLASSSAVSNMVVSFAMNGSELPTSTRVAVVTGAGGGTAGIRSYSAGTVLAECNGSTDYFEIRGVQTSGGSLSTSVTAPVFSFFQVKFVRPV